jgi:hypothetical protein
MQRFKSPRQAQEFLFAHGAIAWRPTVIAQRGYSVQRVAAGDVCARDGLISPTRLELTTIRLQPVNVTWSYGGRVPSSRDVFRLTVLEHGGV